MNEEGDSKLAKFRKWFRAAVEHSQKWRDEAKEDYEFVAGKQWTSDELKTFEDSGRPAIVINRIKPLLNLLSGYQRLNRYDIDFLPRTADDAELAQVRRGITKYVFDRCAYETVESQVFMDCAIGGIGWFGVKYKYDYEINDGEAVIERVDPFGVYVDPEAHELDYSDAKYLIRARWVDKDELKSVYSDKAEAIEAAYDVYDKIENETTERADINPLWYSSELRKVRLIECWYKERAKKTMFYLNNGQMLSEDEVKENLEIMYNGAVVDYQEIPVIEVRCCTFFDKVLLEDIDSPYEHAEFPYIPMIYHHYGIGDEPAGVVRSLKDPQREVNKRRIQELHILNTTANGGGWIEEDAMTPEQEAEFKRMNNVPGHFQRVRFLGKIRERETKNPPLAIIQAEQQAVNDLTSISGINEQLLGTEVPASSSGRAIELRQKQAITHLAVIFDNLRRAKKRIAFLLWGKRGHKGLIPQYYTDEKVYRVEGENGQQFIKVNQQVVQQDPIAGVIHSTLNDLSQGEFDIVVAEVESTTTQRQAQLWNLIDAAGKLGIPGTILFDTIIDLSDIPKKNDIKQRYQQMQQEQAQAAQQQMQMQMQLEEIKNRDFRQQITFKDAPLPIQLAMAAAAGYIDKQVADYFINMWLRQMAPQLVEQMQQNQQMAMSQAQQAQVQTQLPLIQPKQQPNPNSKPLTDAAINGIREQLTPAV